MAAIATIEDYHRGPTTRGTTTWLDVLTMASADFVAGGKYLILCFGHLQGGTANLVECRVVHGTTPTQFTGSNRNTEHDSGNGASPHQYGFFTVFTQPGGGAEDIKYQIRSDGSTTANTRQITMLAIRLDADLTENVDWFSNENTTSDDNTTSVQDRASVTWTPGTAGHDWLVLTRGEYAINDVAGDTMHHTVFDGTDALMADRREGEDTNELWTVMQLWALEGVTAASHTVKVQSKDVGGSTRHTHESSAVFLLNLDKFEKHTITKLGSPVNTVGWSETQIISQIHTPDTTGDQIVLGGVVLDGKNSSNFGFWQMTFGGADDPTNFDTDIQDCLRMWGADDQPTGVYGIIRNMTTSGETISHRGWTNNTTGTPQWVDAIVVSFSAELAPGLQNITPGLTTQSVAATDPDVEMNIDPNLFDGQPISGLFPDVEMNIDGGPGGIPVQSNLIDGELPTVSLGLPTINPDLVSQLLAALALSQVNRVTDITADLKMQLLAGVDPSSVSTILPPITPGVVSQLMQAFSPSDLTIAALVALTARTLGRFYRITRSGQAVLSLMPAGRRIRSGVPASEGHEPVSALFAHNTGEEEDIHAMLAAIWAAHSGSPAATLNAEINAALHGAGYRGPGGISLV